MTMASQTLPVITIAASVGEKAMVAFPHRKQNRMASGWMVSASEAMDRISGHQL